MKKKHFYLVVPVAALSVVIGVHWLFATPDASSQVLRKEKLLIEPCLPKVKMTAEWVILEDAEKQKLAHEKLEKAEKSYKSMANDPQDLWESLLNASEAEILLNHCKNEQETLKKRTIDLKSTLVEMQVTWAQRLQMEVVRHRRERNHKEMRFCLRKLLRLFPDETHPKHREWLSEVSR